jgi:hypothetical protein
MRVWADEEGFPMDVELARHIIRVNFRCSRELQDLMQLLKKGLPNQEYTAYARAIAGAIAAMGDALTEKAVASHPELKREIERSLAKYDRYL